MTTTVLTSGGFDPLHVGHLRLLVAARDLAGPQGRLIVCLNSDLWLMQKKGYVFMPASERKEILNALSCVNQVWTQEWDGPDMAPALRYWRPDVFAKGGDRATWKDLPDAEIEECLKQGIRIAFGVGGGKVRSSQELVKACSEPR